MTNEQVKRFLSLFMGREYASAKIVWGSNSRPVKSFDPYSCVGIFEWKEYMEKNHAELWKDYCRCMDVDGKGVLYEVIALIFNPRNLAEFLLEHKEEWGWVECKECMGHGTEICNNPDHGFIEAMQYNDIGRLGCPCCGHDVHGRIKNTVCDNCKGIGKIKHPALVWAEKEGL